MPIRKINYTGRGTIKKQDIRIIISEGGVFSVEEIAVKKSCPDSDIPDNALVLVEPYNQTQRRHVSCGTVGNLTVPSEEERNLQDFGEVANVLFRIKIINAEEGNLLAEANSYRPIIGDKPRKSIISVESGDIGPECWYISYGTDSVKLLINKEFGDWKEIARSHAFMAFVYPSVLREILTHIFRQVEELDWDGDDDFSRWLRFGIKLTGENPLTVEDGDYDAADEWVKDAVSAFSRGLGVIALGKKVFDNEE